MPKYLLTANYTETGIQGLVQDGGSKRRAAASKAIEGLGGKVESFYYSFGDNDAYVIFDAPDNVATTAVCLAVAASGAVMTSTRVSELGPTCPARTARHRSSPSPSGRPRSRATRS